MDLAAWWLPVTLRSIEVEIKTEDEQIQDSEREGTGPNERKAFFQALLQRKAEKQNTGCKRDVRKRWFILFCFV